MHVLQMISKNDRYGAQRIFLDQVAILQKMGHQVTVVARGNEGFVTESVRAMGLTCHGVSMKRIKDLLFLIRLVKKNKIDVIHTTLDRADYFGLVLSWVTGTPVLSTMMVLRCHHGYRFMDKVITLSRKQTIPLKERGVRASKITLIRPGIDVFRFSRADAKKKELWQQKLRTKDYSLVFCHIASLLERKAHRVSFELVQECKKRGERPLLVIIGDPLQGEYYESLLSTAVHMGISENIHFTGWTVEVPEILSLCHFTLLPSENEALGIVLMEGMAAGTPIVARLGEGGAELIEEYGTGFLYRPEAGVAPLADEITHLKRDGMEYDKLREKCRQVADKNFTLTHFGEMLVQAYQTLTPHKA